MVIVEQHPNMDNWINVHLYNKLVDQFTSRPEALRLAKTLARKHRTGIMDLDKDSEIKIK